MNTSRFKEQPVSDVGWFYPETWTGMEALVKSTFYAGTKGSGDKPEKHEAEVPVDGETE